MEYKIIFTETYREIMENCLGSLKDYFDVIISLRDCILANDRMNINTTYSAIRQALIYVERFIPEDISICSETLTDEKYLNSFDLITKYTLIEFSWSYYLKKMQLNKGIPFTKDYKLNCAILRGICRSNRAIDSHIVLMLLPLSDYSPNLIREIISNSKFDDTKIMTILKQMHLFHDLDDVLFLDFAAAFKLNVLPFQQIKNLFKSYKNNITLFLALIRYINQLKIRDDEIYQLLYDLFLESQSTQLTIFLANSIFNLDNSNLSSLLQRKLSTTNLNPLIQSHLKTIQKRVNIKNSNISSEKGLKIAQCVCFKGIHQDPGKGSSGGLGVFLLSLGDEIAKHSAVSRVTTLVLIQTSELDESLPLIYSRTEKHRILKIPIYSENVMDSYEMMTKDFFIEHTLESMLQIYNINPDILHIRFSDDGSKIALNTLKKINSDIKIAFTVTPEPLRRLASLNFEQFKSEEDEKSIFYDLHNSFVADYLVNSSDGYILLPHRLAPHNIFSLFPQLSQLYNEHNKPIKVIPEGINSQLQTEDADKNIIKFLRKQSSPDQLNMEMTFLAEPTILNVGRLSPIKQQAFLVQAWVDLKLYRKYNLIIIGGNHERPSVEEKEVLDQIDFILRKNPKVLGKFWLLPAIPNSQIRQLEYKIQENNHVNIYLVSSFKEEFGIAAIEALEAGFLLLNPNNSGLSYYLTEGETGFMIETSSLATMKRDISNILDNYQDIEMREIAQNGKMLCLNKFNIQNIASEFVTFYQKLKKE